MNELSKKVKASIHLLKSVAAGVNEPIELCYSGGKDSDVILHLSRTAGIDVRPIYKNTTIDPPGTIKHCIENQVEINQPTIPFFKLIEKKGFPNRFSRFCCSKLKEYPIMNHAIMGIRKCESVKRDKRYNEPTACRIYGKNSRVFQIFPILNWTNDDIKEYINSECIRCHPLYYIDERFNVSKRLGCIGCPLQYYKSQREDFIQYPKMLKKWCDHGNVWFQRMKEKGSSMTKHFNSIYEEMEYYLFFDDMVKFRRSKKDSGHLFKVTDSKERLSEYFKIDL